MKKVVIIAMMFIWGISSNANAGEGVIYTGGAGLDYQIFSFEHIEGANERVVTGEDHGLCPPGVGPYIEISSNPYPYDTPLGTDKRNKKSTLPIDISCILTGIASADGNLYFDLIDETVYEHRNLTIQEVDPCDPGNPNNPNPIYDIKDIIENHSGILDASTFQQDVVRMFRIGVYTKLLGDIYEDGQVDFNDVNSLTDEWLYTTYDSNGVYVGNNYDVSDRNHDGFSNFIDFAIVAEDWLKEE